MKVAHHGSKYSTSSGSLSVLQPSYAFISCGLDNSYGHPHKEVIDRLEEAKSHIKITYESGAIQVETDGTKASDKGPGYVTRINKFTMEVVLCQE
ncbi:MAG: putative rane protein [Herbinix sp.]|jgi:competence protein ComEC|nr:putative rane protein [Herbinix sp.]